MPPVDLEDPEALRRAYVDEGLSLSTIADMAGCSYASVRRALLAHGIDIRRSGPAPIGDLRDKAWLRARVDEGCSATDIAALLGCAEGTVRSALLWAGLGPRILRARPAELDDPAFLRREYEVEHRSVRSIAEEIGCSKDVVLGALRSHGVAIRGRGRSPRDVAAPVWGEPVEPVEPAPDVLGVPVGSAPAAPDAVVEQVEPDVVAEPAPDAVPEPDVAFEPPPAEWPGSGAPGDPHPGTWVVPGATSGKDRRSNAGAVLGAGDEERSPWAEPAATPADRPSEAREAPVIVTVSGAESQVPAPPMPPPSATAPPPAPPVTVPLGRIEVELDKIEAKTFSVVRRGYDRDEVRAFLTAVAEDYRQVIRSAKEAVNAARAAAPPAPAPLAPTPPAPPRPAPPSGRAFEDIGGRVTAVLTTAAEAAEEITSAAEKEALAIRQRAREESEYLRRAAADALAEVEQTRAAGDRIAVELEAEAQARAAAILVAAEQRAAQLEDDAKQRTTTMERTVRANIDAVIAEARRDYEHLRSAQQQCIDRLASVEFLARHARDGMSENAGQSIEELL